MRGEKEITILGAGLAGLACAATLQKNNIPYCILEPTDRVGGRIKTDLHPDGFLLDRGFQVLLNSYPELPGFLDLRQLKLQKFGSGAKIFDGKQLHLLGNPVQHPFLFYRSLTTPFAKLSDKLLVMRLLATAFSQQIPPPQSTLQYLTDFGFSTLFIDFFWRPFFAGIYLDPDLSVDASFFLFLLRCFGVGSVSVPENGMEAIPKQMASRLAPVTFLDLSEIDALKQKSALVVQAYQGDLKSIRSATTYYFACDSKLDWGKWLILVPAHLKLQVNHLVLLSAVAPSYAPQGQQLISATVVNRGPVPAEAKIANEIEEIAGRSLQLKHLRTDAIDRALPAYHPQAPQFLQRDFGYECGDHLSSPSSNGALRSGRLAAEAMIKNWR